MTKYAEKGWLRRQERGPFQPDVSDASEPPHHRPDLGARIYDSESGGAYLRGKFGGERGEVLEMLSLGGEEKKLLWRRLIV